MNKRVGMYLIFSLIIVILILNLFFISINTTEKTQEIVPITGQSVSEESIFDWFKRFDWFIPDEKEDNEPDPTPKPEPPPAYRLGSFSTCQTITEPGNYFLETDLTSTGDCLTILSDDVILDCDSHSITYGTDPSNNQYYGIQSDGYDNIEIMNCEITTPDKDNQYRIGINLKNSENHKIEDNDFTKSYRSVQFENIIDSEITGNEFHDAMGYTNGIRLLNSNNNFITKNNFYEGVGSGGGGYMMVLSNSDYNTIQENDFDTWGFGPYLVDSHYNTVDNNTIYYCWNGDGIILKDGSSYNTVSNNEVTYCYHHGLFLWNGASYNIVRENIFNYNSRAGGGVGGFGAAGVFTNPDYSNYFGNNFTNIIANYNSGGGVFAVSQNCYFENITTNNNLGVGFSVGKMVGPSIATGNKVVNAISNNNMGRGVVVRGIDNDLTEIFADNNSHGVVIIGSGGSLTDSILSNNQIYDLEIDTRSDCDIYIDNIIGTGGEPILFYNSEVNLQDISSSEIIFCKADNSSIKNLIMHNQGNNGLFVINSSNIVLDGLDIENSYRGLQVYKSNNFSLENSRFRSMRGMAISIEANKAFFKNLFVSESGSEETVFQAGMVVYIKEECLFENVSSNNNHGEGFIFSRGGDNCILSGVIANNNSGRAGIDLGRSSNLIVKDTITNNNSEYGIYSEIGNNNIFTNITSNDNAYGIGGFRWGNEITNSTFKNNRGAGIQLLYQPKDGLQSYMTLVHNNYFENEINVGGFGNAPNYFNDSFGGNYWANPGGNGFSETCFDADENGICDSAYFLNSANIDYLPLSRNPFSHTNPYPCDPENNNCLDGYFCSFRGICTRCFDNDGDNYNGESEGDPMACFGAYAYDCNDTNPDIHPYADEICENEIDDDCDYEIDEEDCVGGSGSGEMFCIEYDDEEDYSQASSISGPISWYDDKRFGERHDWCSGRIGIKNPPVPEEITEYWCQDNEIYARVNDCKSLYGNDYVCFEGRCVSAQFPRTDYYLITNYPSRPEELSVVQTTGRDVCSDMHKDCLQIVAKYLNRDTWYNYIDIKRVLGKNTPTCATDFSQFSNNLVRYYKVAWAAECV